MRNGQTGAPSFGVGAFAHTCMFVAARWLVSGEQAASHFATDAWASRWVARVHDIKCGARSRGAPRARCARRFL
eukprot:4941431-Alexandrium_andersonii.AAC.1